MVSQTLYLLACAVAAVQTANARVAEFLECTNALAAMAIQLAILAYVKVISKDKLYAIIIKNVLSIKRVRLESTEPLVVTRRIVKSVSITQRLGQLPVLVSWIVFVRMDTRVSPALNATVRVRRQVDNVSLFFVCLAVTCPDPILSSNGAIVGDCEKMYNTPQCKVGCSEGYKLTSAELITCQANRQWSGLPHTCASMKIMSMIQTR